jgi:opacity protein-like surface antigen
MGRVRTIALMLAALLGFAGTAGAQETSWQIGLSLDSVQEEFDDSDFPFDFDDSRSLGLKVGYRFSESWTFEGELDFLDEFDLSDSVGSGLSLTTATGEIESRMLLLNVKFNPLSNRSGSRFRPYLMLGAGVMDSELDLTLTGAFTGVVKEDDTEAVFQIGAGMDIYATDHWILGLESKYRRPTSDLRELEHWTFGATFMYAF